MIAEHFPPGTSMAADSVYLNLFQSCPFQVTVPSCADELERNGTPPPRLRHTMKSRDFGACIEKPATPGL
jgi:hypothetical protein